MNASSLSIIVAMGVALGLAACDQGGTPEGTAGDSTETSAAAPAPVQDSVGAADESAVEVAPSTTIVEDDSTSQ